MGIKKGSLPKCKRPIIVVRDRRGDFTHYWNGYKFVERIQDAYRYAHEATCDTNVRKLVDGLDPERWEVKKMYPDLLIDTFSVKG